MAEVIFKLHKNIKIQAPKSSDKGNDNDHHIYLLQSMISIPIFDSSKPNQYWLWCML